MVKIKYNNIDQILDLVENNKLVILVGSTKNCSVCTAIRPRLENMLEKYKGVKEIYISIDDMAEVSGEFMIFTVPTIIVFAEGKEIHRESRIIDFKRLEFEIDRWHGYLYGL